jgi:hypothetical protein
LQFDETFLNKGKLSKLAKKARPKKDKLWLWGITVQGHPHLFYFKVLKHVEDAFDGKPRGKEEILQILNELGIPEGMKAFLVSDSWRGTIAAVKQYIQDHGVSDRNLTHELVNHSAGEIVNPRGFTTNGIENRWSALKRWVRKRCNGKLPSTTDRDKWARLVGEFQLRKFLQSSASARASDDIPVMFNELVNVFVA